MKKILIGFLASIGFLTLTLAGILFYNANHLVKAPVVYEESMPDQALLTLSLSGAFYEGPQRPWMPFFKGGASAMSLRSALDAIHHASQDNRVKGLLIIVDNAHMGLAQIQEFHDALKRFKEAGKSIFVHTDTFGDGHNGTATYFLASIANEIAMQPYGSMYLLGIGFDLFHGRAFLENLHIKPRFSKRKEYKNVFDFMSEKEITPGAKASLESLGQTLLDQILGHIAQERDLSMTALRQTIDGAPYHGGQKAQSLGLIDRILYREPFMDHARATLGPDVKAVEFRAYWANEVARQTPQEEAPNSIAVVYAAGAIQNTGEQGFSPFSGGEVITPDAVGAIFKQIEKIPSIKAVVLRVNSPGGAPAPSETLWYHIRRLRDKGKPVVVSFGDYGASGAYWMATAADAIVALPATLTGSIGVAGGKIVVEDLLHEMGIQTTHMTFGDNALIYSPHKDFSEKESKNHEEGLDYIYGAFLHRVAEGRNMSVDKVKSLAKGRVWTGLEAHGLGLVDHLGGLKKALEVAQKLANIPQEEEVNILEFPKLPDFLPFLQTLIFSMADTAQTQSKLMVFLKKSVLGPLLFGESSAIQTQLRGGELHDFN